MLTILTLSVQSQRPNISRGERPNTSRGESPRTRMSQINVVKKCLHQTNSQIENLKGNVKSVYEYKYEAVQEYGQLIKKKKEKNGKDSEEYRTLNQFNPQGDLITVTGYNREKAVSNIREYTYLHPGMVSSISYLNAKHELRAKDVFEYDANGYLVSEIYSDSGGKVNSSVRYTIEFISNQMVQVVKVFQNDTLVITDTTDRSFDLDTLLQYEAYASKHSQEQCFKKYNEKRQLVRDEYRKPNRVRGATTAMYISSVATYKYDDKGNITNIDWEYFDMFDGSSTKTFEAFQYTYDTRGNWIKQVASGHSIIPYDEGKNMVVREREISYY